MSRRWILTVAILVGLMAWYSGVGLTDDEQPQDEPVAPEVQPPAPRAPAVPSTLDLARAIAERNRLVEAHDVFKRLVGTWDVESTLQMGPGEPLHQKGVQTYSLVYDGRFLRWEYKDANSAYQKMGLIGYNTETKLYEETWIDTTSTAIRHGEGKFDAHTGVFTLNFPKLTEVGTYPMRRVEAWAQADVITASTYGGSGRSEVLIVRETLTRRQDDAPGGGGE